MIKIIDKFELSMFTLEQMLEDIKNKSAVEIKQKGVEENFIKIYNSTQKYVHTPEQRKKAKEIQKKYNEIQVKRDNINYPKGVVHKEPLYLGGFLNNLGKPIKINYK